MGSVMKMDRKGQALVEFAMALLVFLPLLLAVIELGIMFYVNLTMQHAVREGTRYAVTGQSKPGSDRMLSLIRVISDSSNGLYDKNLHDPKDPVVSVVSPTQVTFNNFTGTPTTGTPGAANDIIVVRLDYSWALLTPVLKPFFSDGKYTFTVRSTMKNEFF